jgi:hypothetical protein
MFYFLKPGHAFSYRHSLQPLGHRDRGFESHSGRGMDVCMVTCLFRVGPDPFHCCYALGSTEEWAQAVAYLVAALCYKPEGRGFESR